MSVSEKSKEEIAAAAKKNAAAYWPEIPAEAEPARLLLHQYSGIPLDEVDNHIFAVRDKAWAVFPYGCVGSFGFLNITHTTSDPMFQDVTKRLTAADSTETFLDVGCCLGAVVRHLAAEGVSSERLYGTDLQPHFLDLGYELFRDRDEAKSKATFVAGDMLNPDSKDLDELTGKIDIIYAASFFHLFERNDQVKAAKRMVSFLRPERKNALIFGCNGGPKCTGWEKYVLDTEAWEGLWEEVGRATGTRWQTQMDIDEKDETIKVRFAVSQV